MIHTTDEPTTSSAPTPFLFGENINKLELNFCGMNMKDTRGDVSVDASNQRVTVAMLEEVVMQMKRQKINDIPMKSFLSVLSDMSFKDSDGDKSSSPVRYPASPSFDFQKPVDLFSANNVSNPEVVEEKENRKNDGFGQVPMSSPNGNTENVAQLRKNAKPRKTRTPSKGTPSNGNSLRQSAPASSGAFSFSQQSAFDMSSMSQSLPFTGVNGSAAAPTPFVFATSGSGSSSFVFGDTKTPNIMLSNPNNDVPLPMPSFGAPTSTSTESGDTATPLFHSGVAKSSSKRSIGASKPSVPAANVSSFNAGIIDPTTQTVPVIPVSNKSDFFAHVFPPPPGTSGRSADDESVEKSNISAVGNSGGTNGGWFWGSESVSTPAADVKNSARIPPEVVDLVSPDSTSGMMDCDDASSEEEDQFIFQHTNSTNNSNANSVKQNDVPPLPVPTAGFEPLPINLEPSTPAKAASVAFSIGSATKNTSTKRKPFVSTKRSAAPAPIPSVDTLDPTISFDFGSMSFDTQPSSVNGEARPAVAANDMSTPAAEHSFVSLEDSSVDDGEYSTIDEDEDETGSGSECESSDNETEGEDASSFIPTSISPNNNNRKPPPFPDLDTADMKSKPQDPDVNNSNRKVPLKPPAAKSAQSSSDNKMMQMAELYRKQGKEQYEKENFEIALDYFSKSLKIAPLTWTTRATVYGNRAATLMMLERLVEASDDCTQATTLDPSLIKLHGRKGRALCRLGHLVAATTTYNTLLHMTREQFVDTRQSSGNVADKDSMRREYEGAMNDATSGMKQIQLANELLAQLTKLDIAMSYTELLYKADELLQICPQMRIVHNYKAKALNKLGKFSDAKEFIEEVSCNIHETILKLYAHPAAEFPVPSVDALMWSLSKTVSKASVISSLDVSVANVANAMLYMGSDMAQIYLITLKNQDICRLYCAEVMSKLCPILRLLLQRLNNTTYSPKRRHGATGDFSVWVASDLANIESIINLKSKADGLFKSGHFGNALSAYTDCLAVDTEAQRWNAVLHCNRAAAYMSLKKYAEAVNDCNKSIALDENYSRAHLRRARAHKAQDHYAAAIRDYRRYLSSDPIPTDAVSVQKEMDQTTLDKNQRFPSNSGSPVKDKRTSGFGRAQEDANTFLRSQQQARARQQQQAGANTANKSRAGPPPIPKASYMSGGSGPAMSAAEKARQQHEEYAANFMSSGFSSDDDEYDDYNDLYSNMRKAASAGGGGRSNPVPPRSFKKEVPQEKPRSSTHSTSGSYGHTWNGSGWGGSVPPDTSSNRKAPPNPPKANIPPPPPPKSKEPPKAKIHPKGDDDHYATLGVSENCTERELKIAYRKLALKFHPDKNKDAGAEDMFKTITSAHSVLSDKVSRRQYDLSRPSVQEPSGYYGYGGSASRFYANSKW